MTALFLLIATLALILIPLAALTLWQKSSQASRIGQAWNNARERQQLKNDTLQALEQRLAASIETEQNLLADVQQLRQDINALPSQPDRDALDAIETATETALGRLAGLLELQVDSEGQPRLKTPIDQLAASHADNANAIARLDDVLKDSATEAPASDAPSLYSDDAPGSENEQEQEQEQLKGSERPIGLLIQAEHSDHAPRLH